MKKYSIFLLIVTMISLPGLASAQTDGCATGNGSQTVLTVDRGQPLTQLQADCMLDLIDFMAIVVKGTDVIQVNEPMRQIWRNYMANSFAMLRTNDRNWLLNSPAIYANWSVAWPQQTPASRAKYRETWAAALPTMMKFVQPVLLAAQQQNASQSATSQNSAPAYGQSPQTKDPAAAYNREQAINNSLAVHNYQMSINTINLMHAMSPH